MRNSLLAQEFRAEDSSGLKSDTEDKSLAFERGGRRASPSQRSLNVSEGGAMGSENVGMSNRNDSESLSHRKPKDSLAMIINQG